MSELESVRMHFSLKLESVRSGKCQNWKVSEAESVRIGKFQNWKMSELESVRSGKCQNSMFSRVNFSEYQVLKCDLIKSHGVICAECILNFIVRI